MKGLLFSIALLSSFVLGGAINLRQTEAEAKSDTNIKLYSEEHGIVWRGDLTEIVDEETGVHYLIVDKGHTQGGVAITPMYEANGILKTSK